MTYCQFASFMANLFKVFLVEKTLPQKTFVH